MSALPIENGGVVAPALDPRAPSPRGRREAIVTALFGVLGLPLAAHVAFSRLGFNPTDDGFVLAYGRRLLDGGVPHRDFISIRPIGSALLHLPELLIAGDFAFLAGRLVTWIEIGVIAWSSVALARRLSGRPRGALATSLALVAAFVFTASTVPILPWHTIDALALSALGLVLATSSSPPALLAGAALVGAAALCRQNFLPMGLLATALAPKPWRARSAIAWIAPAALGTAALALLGALPDAVEQLRAQTDVWHAGVSAYLGTPVRVGLALGAGVAVAGRAESARGWARVLAAGTLATLLVWAAWTMSLKGSPFSTQASFVLFGASLGCVLASLARARSAAEVRFGAVALALAWCASISIGMNSPVYAAGVLAVHLLVSAPPSSGPRTPHVHAMAVVSLATLIAITALSVHARRERIYRDRPAAELTASLDGILPGGRGLLTNRKTAELMADLQRAVALARGRPVAIVADFPAYWVRSAQRNPLSIDWPQGTELSRPRLRARVIEDLERLRGRVVIVVQRHHTAHAARAFVPTVATGDYFLVAHVRDRFRKFDGTAHFDLYE